MSYPQIVLVIVDRVSAALRCFLKGRISSGSILYQLCRRPSMWLRHHMPMYVANYRQRKGNGIFFREEELGMCSLLPDKVLAKTLQELKPLTILDVGCGTGQAVKWFLSQGCDVVGLEGSELAIKHSEVGSYIRLHDLRKSIDLCRKFDLVWSFEVAEHLPENSADCFVETLQRHGDRVVMSAAPPGQGGEGHLNEQPREYWIGKFEAKGWQLDQGLTQMLQDTGDFLSSNMMAFHSCSSRNQ